MAFSPTLFSFSSLHFFPKMPPTSLSVTTVHQPLPLLSSLSATAAATAGSFDLRSYWTSLISEIETELVAALPVHYPERIHEAMRHPVLSGGAKRAPTVMCVAACELVGGPRSAALPCAAALEMVHAASLVHNDLPCMDAARLRRGRPSTHALFGADMAILAGDALFPLAFQHIVARTPSPSPVPHATVLAVLAEIARAVGSGGMAAGQFLDLTSLAAGGEREVILVLEKKFGEMAECSAVCGGLLGGADEEEAGALRRYGRAVGVLYQLVDDILMEPIAGSGKMRRNASVVRAVGMDRALELTEELRSKAKKELEPFSRKYGDKALPLYSFVDYAIERGLMVESGDAAS